MCGLILNCLAWMHYKSISSSMRQLVASKLWCYQQVIVCTVQVKAYVPQDRLLVYKVSDGWGPLCAFLGVPVPSSTFPYENKSQGDDDWPVIEKVDLALIALPFATLAALVAMLLHNCTKWRLVFVKVSHEPLIAAAELYTFYNRNSLHEVIAAQSKNMSPNESMPR